MDVGGRRLDMYVVTFPRMLKSVAFLVDGLPERTHNPGRLMEKCMYRHRNSKIVIIQEILTPIPQCDQFRMHMLETRLGRHSQTTRCNRTMDIRLWRKDEEISQISG